MTLSYTAAGPGRFMQVAQVGNWIWNTRKGAYEWRERSSSWLTWLSAFAMLIVFVGFILLGVALFRQAVIADRSGLAPLIARGDPASIAEYALALGQWGLVVGAAALQGNWPL